MATGWSSSKKENTNFARLCRLLIDGGTHVLRDIFDSIHPPSSLHSVLHRPAVHNTLQGLKAKKVLTRNQWDRLYPKTGTTVTSAGFDITLLFVLLRNICGLSPPATGWDNLPPPTDNSREADLARVKLYRNELYGHISETAVSDSEFESNWKEISDVLIRLGGPRYKADIERLKVETMDFEDEKYFIKTLEEWEETEKDLKMAIKESEQRMMDRFVELEKKVGDRIADKSVKDSALEAERGKTYVLDIESTSDKREDKDVCTRVQDYTKKLKLSIKNQTDFQPRMREKKIRTDDIFTNVTILRGQKRFKKDQSERFDRRQFDEVKATLKTCSEMFICPENDDPKSTATVKTNPKSILLIGKAGIGKTLFCRKLVRDWANDSLFEKEEKSKAPIFEFVLLLTFHQLNRLGQKELGLRDILNCSSLLDEYSIIDEALFQYMNENPEKLLLIIDGYDEYNYRDKITSDFETLYPNDPSKEIPVPAMVDKLLKGKILHDSVVLISSRPGEENEALKKTREITFDATVEITGFSSLQVMKYVENYFQENESLKNAVLNHIKANDFFVSFGEIPVMCFLMCCYMEWHVTESRTATTLPVTRTDLYHEVIKVFIKKDYGYSKYREMTEIEIQQTLLKLAELAFNLTRDKKYIFEEEDMKKSNLSEREITNLKASGLLDCCPGVKTSPFDEPTLEYVFTHLTIQEYLCAVRCVKTKQIPDKEETSGVTLIFMAGILSRNKDENFMKKLVKKIEPRDDRDYINKLLVLNVLHEYGEAELSKLIIDNLYHKYCDSDGWIVFGGITYLDCVCISYLLNAIKLTNTRLTSHKHSVNTLFIGHSSLFSSCVQVLCQSLVHHHNITKLVLCDCELDDKCVNVIANYLLRTKITHLHLMYNNITDVGVKCVCNVLIKDNSCVEVLHLSGNDKITVECQEYHINLVQKRKPHVRLMFGSFGDETVPAEVLARGEKAKEAYQLALDSIDNKMNRAGNRRKEEVLAEVLAREINRTGDRRKKEVPAEVLARGKKAKEAYQRALEEGEVEVYRGRIMLIGQDRAGKTSLKKALLGLTFDPKEPSTVGVDVNPSEFCVDVDNVIDWHKVEGNKKSDFEENISKIIAEEINERTKDPEPEPILEPQKPEEVHKQPTDDENKVQDSMPEPSLLEEEAPIQHGDDDSLNDTSDDAAKSENNDSETITPRKGKEEHETIPDENVTGDVDVPETVIKTLIKRLKSKNLDEFSSKDKVTVSIWDFAGQHLYYASHPVFFSPRAVYVLVYNLNKDLKAVAEPCVRQGVHDIKLDNHEKQTNLEAILSWLVSVHNARPENDNKKLDYERPPVIIVGTHADCPFDKKPVTEMETIIKKSMNEKTYDKHVVRPYITVDNTLSSKDEGVKKLKDKIKELFRMEPYMGERVPVRWFIFERVIRSLLEDKTYHLPVEDLQKVIAEVCHINNQDEITAMLNFYHDLGVIVKHGNTVVLQAEWLIDLFRKLITIRPYKYQNPVHSEHWKNLEKCGILDMDLVDHVFKGIIENGNSTKDDILAMMEHYGLIARFSTADQFHYFVPCQLQSLPGDLIDAEPSPSDPCALYFHFTDGFIPHGLYYCLVSKVIAWCSDQGYPQEPKLFKNVSRFFIGDSCQYDMFLMCRKRFVKVVLRSHEVEGSLDIHPAFLVRSFLEECLTDLKDGYLGYRSLTCETSVLCPTCSESDTVCDVHNCVSCRDDDCLHLLPVGNNQVLLCKKSFCKNSRPKVSTLKEWYRDPSIVAAVSGEESEECGGDLSDTVSSTFNLDDNHKRWLVIGISLNKVLLPTLQDFVKQNMVKHYDDLKANQNIDKQSYSKHLVNDGKCDKLNYQSINNNAKKKEKICDYNVISAVDLAKLYLRPHMAQFSDFDETCDLSAVLGILSSASVFSPDVQDSANNVRQDVRNEWGHCNFQKWEEPKFTSCFHLMNCLLKTLMLKSDDEKLITDHLQDWENKGVQVCMGNKVSIELITTIEKEVNQLSLQFNKLASSLHDESKRVISALQTTHQAIEEFKRDLRELKQRVGKLEQGRTEDCRRMDGMDKRFEALESASVLKSNQPSEDIIEAKCSDNKGKGKKSKKQDGKEEKRTSKKSNNSCRCEIA